LQDNTIICTKKKKEKKEEKTLAHRALTIKSKCVLALIETAPIFVMNLSGTLDYRDVKTKKKKKVGELRGHICAIRHSLFQKTPIITPRNRIFQPRETFEDIAFKPGFDIVKF
jgi:hypothetical protein